MTQSGVDHTPGPTENRRSATTPSSERLWGLDWKSILPWRFADISVEAGELADALPFVEAHYPGIFKAPNDHSRFLNDPMTAAKERFCAEMDTFIFRDGDKTIGLLMSHPSDWSSYYMRTVAILPEYRERRLLTHFMEALYEPLRAVGVERIDGDIAPVNEPMIRMLTGQDFIVTATTNTERWGLLVRYTKFLRAQAEDVFRKQFTYFPPKRRIQKQPKPD